MHPLIIIGIVVISLIILLFITLLIIYCMAFYNSKKSKNNYFDVMNGEEYAKYRDKIKENINKVKEIPYQQVKIQSRDGKTLVAKYYHVAKGAPVDIQCHGYKGNGLRDFSGGLQMSLNNGHNVLLIDHRGQGDSSGHTITFGIKERHDVLDWIYYIILKYGKDVKIFLVGISMGAATVFMALGLKLPKNVVGVIADCPYTSPKEIILKVVKDMKLPAKLLSPFISLSAYIFGGFRLSEYSSIEGVKNSKVPILLIHGGADSFVPCEMSMLLKKENQEIQLEIFDNAPHGMSYLVDEERYIKLVKNFVNKILKEDE